MAKSLQAPLPPMAVQSLASPGAAHGSAVDAGPARSIAMTAVVKDALQDHYGKLEVAARAMRNMDPSQLSRELKDGTFKFDRLDALDQDGKAAVTHALHQVFGPVADPKAWRRRLLRNLRRALDELEDAEAVA